MKRCKSRRLLSTAMVTAALVAVPHGKPLVPNADTVDFLLVTSFDSAGVMCYDAPVAASLPKAFPKRVIFGKVSMSHEELTQTSNSVDNQTVLPSVGIPT